MLDLLKKKDITSYDIRKNNIIGQATFGKIKNNGNIDMRTINTMCKLLDCQPGDLMEYVPDNDDNNINADN